VPRERRDTVEKRPSAVPHHDEEIRVERVFEAGAVCDRLLRVAFATP